VDNSTPFIFKTENDEMKLKNLSAEELKELKVFYLQCKEAYYSGGSPMVTDAQFDKIEQALTDIDPGWKELKKVGSPVKKSKIELPYFMPSLDKTYPEGVAAKFNTWNGPVVIMPKLDGASVITD
jgi:NAD-dependent DNA ligase